MLPTAGISTLPILCMMPFVAAISAVSTLTPLIKTPLLLLVTKTESPLAAITFALGPAGTLAAGMAAGITWYNSIFLTASAESPLNTSEVMPAFSKPSFVGANKVKGPGPLSVSTSPALTTAASKVLRSSSLTTIFEMVLGTLSLPSSSLEQDATITVKKVKASKNLFFSITFFI